MFTKFYNLRAEPFLLTPDERFYFESTVHSQAMAHLTYGLTRGEGFIVITGDVGAGKTTLVNRLIATIDANRIIAAHVVTTLLSGHDLLHMVAAAFGLENLPQDKSGLLLRLQTFFNETHQQGRRALLVVDEAQNLSETALEELRMLSNFQIDNAAPFQSFLVGQPQFRRVIASRSLEQLRQRVIASYHLGPLSSLECGQYLMHRLGQVAWKGDPKFEASAVGAIYRHSGGIPRRINTLGSRLMILGFLDELHTFTAEDVNRVATDLANETSVEVLSEAPLPTENDHSSSVATAERLHNLEQRISRQELFVRQVGTVMKHFVHLANSNDA
jgi:general secretion pathway protein A